MNAHLKPINWRLKNVTSIHYALLEFENRKQAFQKIKLTFVIH